MREVPQRLASPSEEKDIEFNLVSFFLLLIEFSHGMIRNSQKCTYIVNILSEVLAKSENFIPSCTKQTIAKI